MGRSSYSKSPPLDRTTTNTTTSITTTTTTTANTTTYHHLVSGGGGFGGNVNTFKRFYSKDTKQRTVDNLWVQCPQNRGREGGRVAVKIDRRILRKKS